MYFGAMNATSRRSADNNQLMARRAWLDRVDIPDSNIHPMPTDEADPAAAACSMRNICRSFHSGWGNSALDLILLGMGDDGRLRLCFPHKKRSLCAIS